MHNKSQSKEYYSLSEIELLNLSKDDICYWVQQRKIRISVFIPERQYIAVAPYTEGKVGQCVLLYEGIVTLSCDDSIELLHKCTLPVTHVTLANRAKAMLVSRKYPYKSPMPNQFISSWESHKLGELPEHDIEAIFSGNEIENMANRVLEMLQKSPVAYPKTFIQKGVEVINQDRVLFQHRHLVEAGLIAPQTVQKELVQDGKGRLSGQRVSDFHELLARILNTDLKTSTKRCEAILRNEVSLPVIERELDYKGILIDISATELVWKSSRGNRQTFKLSSLGPTLSNIKKKLDPS